MADSTPPTRTPPTSTRPTSTSPAGAVAGAAERPPLIWTRLAPTARGRRPGLTHAQIARAAIAIADAEGLEAVSMRRVAAALGVGAMSLYRYVASRDDVVELMVDEVIGELSDEGGDPGDWRATLTGVAHSMRAMIRRHPWLAWQTLATRPTFGPNMLRWVETTIARLESPSLSIDQIMDMSGTVSAFVAGYSQGELAEQEAQRRTGMDEQQWRGHVGPYVMSVLATGDYPRLRRVVIDAEDFPDPDAVFARRLAYVVEGLGARLSLS
jgi:AcrR family transcriptional regulator